MEGVRLADVARQAGVGISTVSRALTNPSRVNAKTRDHVLQVAASMGYAGNLAARRLRSGLSRVVLVMIPSFVFSDVLAPAIMAVDAELMRSGYSMIVGVLAKDRQADPRIIDMARGGFVDGILAITNEPPGEGRELSILLANLPAVGLLTDLSSFGIPSLVTAEREAIEVLAGELIRRGRRHLLYVGGPEAYHEKERDAGFRRAVERAREPVRSSFIEGDYSYESGIEAARKFLALPDRPDGAVIANDNMAMAFMRSVRDAGLRVPEDIAITGFDDVGAAAFCEPPLTTYRQPMERLGTAAARRLLDIIAGEAPDTVTCEFLRGELCIRGSI